MSAKTLISVVIPTYNYGRFVVQAVESALAQTYPRVEVIVVDDGSTDDTAARLSPYMDRIRYIHQANQGLPAARNTGIRAASGELIALLDSDDVWHPRKLEAQAPYLLQNPEVGLVAHAHHRGEPGQWSRLELPPRVQPVTLEELVLGTRFGPSTVLMRKSCFNAVGLFDTSLRSVEDREMWIRVAAQYGVLLLDAPLFWYRVHETSMSNNAQRMQEAELTVLRKAFAAIPALRRRRRLKRRAHACAMVRSAQGYDSSGEHLRALGWLMRSMWAWPLPLAQRDVKARLIRPRKAVMLLLRAMGVAPTEQQKKRRRAPAASVAGEAIQWVGPPVGR